MLFWSSDEQNEVSTATPTADPSDYQSRVHCRFGNRRFPNLPIHVDKLTTVAKVAPRIASVEVGTQRRQKPFQKLRAVLRVIRILLLYATRKESPEAGSDEHYHPGFALP